MKEPLAADRSDQPILSVIMLSYSYRDLENIFLERGFDVDHNCRAALKLRRLIPGSAVMGR